EGRMRLHIEETARELQPYAPVPRIAFFDLTWPADSSEYRAMSGFGVLLVTVISQDADELPLSRVFVRDSSGEAELGVIASLRREVPDTSKHVVRVLGRHRVDSIYQFPLVLSLQRGQLLIDFSRNRKGFVLAELPLEKLPSTTYRIEPPTAARPSDFALAALIQREIPIFSGLLGEP
ncbi:MAG: hypothetical protein ACRDGM_12315, partial [bacterium]